MTRALAYIILIAAIVVIVALRERPAQLAIEAIPAKVTKVQGPMCTAPWQRLLTRPKRNLA